MIQASEGIASIIVHILRSVAPRGPATWRRPSDAIPSFLPLGPLSKLLYQRFYSEWLLTCSVRCVCFVVIHLNFSFTGMLQPFKLSPRLGFESSEKSPSPTAPKDWASPTANTPSPSSWCPALRENTHTTLRRNFISLCV